MNPRLALRSVLLIVAGGCSVDTPPTVVERTDSAGITLVVNRGEDRPLDWEWERTFTLGGADEGPESSKVVDQRGVAEVVPSIRRLALRPDGTLWVQRFAVRGDPETIDVFAAGGEYVGTLPAGSPFPEAFFPDGRFAALEKDDLDVDHVVVYRGLPSPPGGGS
jgi:hypothetical protein